MMIERKAPAGKRVLELGAEETRTVPVFTGGWLIGYATEGAADRIAEDPMIRREVDTDFAGLCRSFPHLFRRVPDGAR